MLLTVGLLLFLCSVFQVSAFSLFNRLIEHTAWSPDISAALSNVLPSNTAPLKAPMAALLLLAAVQLLAGYVSAAMMFITVSLSWRWASAVDVGGGRQRLVMRQRCLMLLMAGLLPSAVVDVCVSDALGCLSSSAVGVSDAIGGLSSSTVGASGGRWLSLMLRVSAVSVSAYQ